MGQEHGGRGDTASESAVTRRLVLASVAGVAGLAGCSGGGGDDGSDDSGGDSNDSSNGSNDGGGDSNDGSNGSNDGGLSIEPMCNVEDRVDGISVVGCQSEIQGDVFVVTVTVENDGDQQTNLFDYSLQSRAYDSGELAVENSVTGSVTVTYEGVPEIQPGETTPVTVEVRPNPGVSVEDIEQYRIELTCGFGADGVYCEES